MTNALTYHKMWQCLLALEKLLIGCFLFFCSSDRGGPSLALRVLLAACDIARLNPLPPSCLQCLLSAGTKPWQSAIHCRTRLPTESASVSLLPQTVSHLEAGEVSQCGVVSVWALCADAVDFALGMLALVSVRVGYSKVLKLCRQGFARNMKTPCANL